MGTFIFGREHFDVPEGDFVEIPILRIGSFDRTQTVGIATSNRHMRIDGENCSACELDYESINCTLTFAVGETTKIVKLYAKLDYFDEPDEYLTIQLLQREYNSLGNPSVAIVKIINMPRQTN
jgi:hypothetical protein